MNFMEPKLSQESIVKTAFDILGEKQSIASLSMRALAKKADVKAPALYWYFSNKQELLQKMAEAMENQLELPDPELPWKQQLLKFMENYYDLYTSFPCGAELEIHTIPAYPSRLEHLEKMITLLTENGFSKSDSNQTILALHNMLIGQLMDLHQENYLRQEIINGNEFLKQSIVFMRTYVTENQLTGLSEGIENHGQDHDKEAFLTSVKVYLHGLSVLKDK
ncbi:transcriptional regulator, TetR family [Enterococcus faecalis 13-SD-W-01]|nr:transcriptional regulator, TetR family [Enterococcus faecalis 13-SD-W-01]